MNPALLAITMLTMIASIQCKCSYTQPP